MSKKLFALIITLTLVFSLGACGAAAQSQSSEAAEPQATEEPQVTEEPEVTEEPQATEEDGQNPVMNVIGVYSTANSQEALVEAEGMEDAKITVTFAANPWFHTETVMSGQFNMDTFTMEFANSAMKEITYNSDGSVKEEKLGYSGGTGKAVFDPNELTLTITEQFPTGDVETLFTWGPCSGMKNVTDPDHYASVTATDKYQVETVIGFNVRRAYLREDWAALADMIRYPITINEKELADKDAFLGFMMDKTVTESDWQAMNDEDCLDMFVNGQGICMGSGQIWMNDASYMTDKEPKLEIIAISGLENKKADAAEAEKKEEEKKSETDYDKDSSIAAYDENGDLYRLYEGTDGYWRQKDGSTYVRLSETEFQKKDGNLRLSTIKPSKESSEEEEPEFERDFYATPSVKVYDEYGESHMLYEGSDGYWREEDGTTYSRVSRKEFQLKDGTKMVKTYYWSPEDDDGGGEDFYSSPSVTVYDENGNSFKIYEGSDGYWREEDGTAYSRISQSEFQRKDGNKRVFVR